MENKINVAELLKDCPSGMPLDCAMWDNLYFDRVEGGVIYCYYIFDGYRNIVMFAKDGCYTTHKLSKCVIFPKGKTTWEGFHRPFEDGDILFYKHKSDNVKYTFIYKRRIDMHYLLQYCGWFSEKPYLSEQFNAKERMPLYENDDIRFATEEERQKLFDAIKANGYKWNAETKTLYKLIEPKFKVGDIIKDGQYIATIVRIYEDSYDVIFDSGGIGSFTIDLQDEWELFPNKFDINTLKPFDKVLVRDGNDEAWVNAFFGFCDPVTYKKCIFVTGNENWCQCIPYEGNEHLLGKTDDCDEYFKNW